MFGLFLRLLFSLRLLTFCLYLTVMDFTLYIVVTGLLYMMFGVSSYPVCLVDLLAGLFLLWV